jgi:hypothetical protein
MSLSRRHSEPTRLALPAGDVSLEEIAHLIHEAGMIYAQAKARFEKLDLFRPSVKAIAMQNALNAAPDTKISETRLTHQAEASKEYRAHLEVLAEAQIAFEVARIHYESLRNLFEAKRSQLSYLKAEMALV